MVEFAYPECAGGGNPNAGGAPKKSETNRHTFSFVYSQPFGRYFKSNSLVRIEMMITRRSVLIVSACVLVALLYVPQIDGSSGRTIRFYDLLFFADAAIDKPRLFLGIAVAAAIGVFISALAHRR